MQYHVGFSTIIVVHVLTILILELKFSMIYYEHYGQLMVFGIPDCTSRPRSLKSGPPL
jgi:hypothetical protein